MVDGHIDNMTPQEAITLLNDVEFADKYQGNDNYTDMLLMCKSALEKQIPKKLICIDIEKCCPVCKEGICLIRDDGNYGNYCTNCGQALDWSDTE